MSIFSKKLFKKLRKKIISIIMLIAVIISAVYLFKPYQQPLSLIDKTYQKKERERLQKYLPKNITITDIYNGKIVEIPYDITYGNPDDPFLKQLRKKEKLDTVVDASANELKQFIQLREWAYKRWTNKKITIWHPFNAIAILNAVDKGYGGFCAHYAIVYLQSALSLGYQARYLDINDHYLLEIWSNQYDKWIAMDPFNNCFYEWKNIPMSALEIHDKILENKMNAIVVNGMQLGKGVLALYKHIAIVIRNNHYTYKGPWEYDTESYFRYLNQTRSTYYLSWKDTSYKEEFFLSQGRSEMLFRLFTSDPDIFNWKINQIKFEKITFDNDSTVATIQYSQNCPHLAYTEIANGSEWKKAAHPSQIYVQLKKGANVIKMRTINVAGIRGPSFYITLQKN